jgi:hypothetical protein
VTPAPAGRTLLQDLVMLTKPRIISLLLVTTIAPMFVAGSPGWVLVAIVARIVDHAVLESVRVPEGVEDAAGLDHFVEPLVQIGHVRGVANTGKIQAPGGIEQGR